MKVILRQDLDNVGLRGEVVDVARGYARNFLLPRKLAEPATPARVAEVEKVAAQRARHEAQSFEQAQEISQRVGQLELRFDVKAGETGVLFGSVTPTDIADTLWERHKVRVDRRKIELAEPIKRIGRYEIPVELFQDVTVQVRTLVVPEGGELPPEEEPPAPEEEAESAAAGAVEREAEEDRYTDEALDEAIAAAEQPERPEAEEEDQVAEDGLELAEDADTPADQ
jgi:large subunit ribosomal protein L9